ncbi:hypothetical protein P8452_22011 [Trifolium repens]|nr:hypothetical protein P8452_22011 [Trifolium repens]
MDSSADEIDKGNKSSFSSFSRSYTPLLFYMDSTINYPGPILKGNKSTPLSSYTTILFSRPAPTNVSNMDIFVINKFYVPSKYHPLSFGMDPTHPGRLRIPYNLPCSTAVFSFGQSQSSEESKSESNSFGPVSSRRAYPLSLSRLWIFVILSDSAAGVVPVAFRSGGGAFWCGGGVFWSGGGAELSSGAVFVVSGGGLRRRRVWPVATPAKSCFPVVVGLL